MAAEVRIVADHRAELGQAGADFSALRPPVQHRNAAMVVPPVGQDHPGAEVRFVADQGVPHIIPVGDFGAVGHDAVFQFAGVSDNHVLPDDRVRPQIAARPHKSPRADVNRSQQYGSMHDLRPRADEDRSFDVDIPADVAFHRRLQPFL